MIRRIAESRWTRAVLLAGFWGIMVAALAGKSLTSDEAVHLTAGTAYWKLGDYRVNPENGNLPQRLAGLAPLAGVARFPFPGTRPWHESASWIVADAFLHSVGNDPAAMLLGARAAMGLAAVALAALVAVWSRELFGPIGALISLALTVLDPTLLAHGALATSDTAAALFFLASLRAFWRLCHRVSAWTVLAAGLALGCLLASKMSAPIVAPVLLALFALRLAAKRPLLVRPPRAPAFRPVEGRSGRAGVLTGAATASCSIAFLLVWAFYGFRYEMMNAPGPEDRLGDAWEVLLDDPVPFSLLPKLGVKGGQRAEFDRIFAPALDEARKPGARGAMILAGAFERFRSEVMTAEQRAKLADLERGRARTKRTAAAIRFAREHRLLPEAYLYGLAHVLHGAETRPAFLNGEIRLGGWRSFFPYTFLVKTPIPIFVVLGLAAWAGLARRPASRGLYETAPLWLFLAFYGAAAISSDLNIGHRHILPLYPVVFILAGASARWLEPEGADTASTSRPAPARLARGALVLALAALAAETALVWPNYIAYFNQIIGRNKGYRHLVDSSLDWGQDLPALARFVDERLAEDPARRIYLSYFGTASPDHLGIRATLLPAMNRDYERRRSVLSVPLGAEPAPGAVEAVIEKNRGFFLLDVKQAPAGTGLGTGTGTREAILVRRPRDSRLTAGLYCVSATMLQPLLYKYYFGPWCERYERIYQSYADLVREIQESDDESALRERLHSMEVRDPARFWERFEDIRFARLAAHLRERELSATLNGSILVYDLTEDDVRSFLLGPSPPFGPDILDQIRR